MTRPLACVALGLALAAASGSGADGAKRNRVAFVTDRDGVNAPIMQQNVAGLRRAGRDFGVEAGP